MPRRCMRCGAALTGDEIALYRKLVFRRAEEFLCMDCLAADCSTTRDRLEDLAAYYHKTGLCSLFAKF